MSFKTFNWLIEWRRFAVDSFLFYNVCEKNWCLLSFRFDIAVNLRTLFSFL